MLEAEAIDFTTMRAYDHMRRMEFVDVEIAGQDLTYERVMLVYARQAAER